MSMMPVPIAALVLLAGAPVAQDVSGTMGTRPPEPAAEKTVLVQEPGTAVELVDLDPATKKITVIGEAGEKQVFQ